MDPPKITRKARRSDLVFSRMPAAVRAGDRFCGATAEFRLLSSTGFVILSPSLGDPGVTRGLDDSLAAGIREPATDSKVLAEFPESKINCCLIYAIWRARLRHVRHG